MGNILLYGLPHRLVSMPKLQCVQNAAAMLVMLTSRMTVTPILKELHWLPTISQRIK